MTHAAVGISTDENEQVFWARFVSDVLSPPVVWAVLAFPIALRDAESNAQAIVWAAVYGLLVCALPVVYIAWMVHRGKITDLHMQVRSERIRPFIVSMICTVMAWGALRLMGAPSMLPMFALFSLVQLGIMLVITLVWQISMHTMTITGAVVTTGALFGASTGVVLSPLVVLVAVARLKLHRHTRAQVIAGTLIGGMAALVLFTN